MLHKHLATYQHQDPHQTTHQGTDQQSQQEMPKIQSPPMVFEQALWQPQQVTGIQAMDPVA